MLAGPSPPTLEGRKYGDPADQALFDLFTIMAKCADPIHGKRVVALNRMRARADKNGDPIAQYMCGKLLRDPEGGWPVDVRVRETTGVY